MNSLNAPIYFRRDSDCLTKNAKRIPLGRFNDTAEMMIFFWYFVLQRRSFLKACAVAGVLGSLGSWLSSHLIAKGRWMAFYCGSIPASIEAPCGPSQLLWLLFYFHVTHSRVLLKCLLWHMDAYLHVSCLDRQNCHLVVSERHYKLKLPCELQAPQRLLRATVTSGEPHFTVSPSRMNNTQESLETAVQKQAI